LQFIGLGDKRCDEQFRVYRVSPAAKALRPNDNDDIYDEFKTDYVRVMVVRDINLLYPESCAKSTLAFPCDKSGRITSWILLTSPGDGSDFASPLIELGYRLYSGDKEYGTPGRRRRGIDSKIIDLN